MKVAVTICAALIGIEQLLVPLQAPLHPINVEPVVGAAVSVTMAPLAKSAVQVAPQVIPGGLLRTAPDPVPAGVTVKA